MAVSQRLPSISTSRALSSPNAPTPSHSLTPLPPSSTRSQVQFCRPHALEGMVDVSTKSCEHHGCFKRPTFGHPSALVENAADGRSATGTKNGQFCAQHALPGMVDVVSKRCEFPGCGTKRSFGLEGSRKNVSFFMLFLFLFCLSPVFFVVICC